MKLYSIRTLVAAAGIACTMIGGQASAYVVGGMPTNNLTAWSWDGPNMAPFRAALEDATNFGPGGVVPVPITTVDIPNANPPNLLGLDLFVSSWWPDTDATAAQVANVVSFFTGGGDLLLFQDDTGHDPIGAALGIPTAGNGGPFPNPSNAVGNSPLHDGLFGIANDVLQHYTKGFLSEAAILAAAGTVSSKRADGELTAAYWNAGDYAPGAGRLVIIADVDMCAQTTLGSSGENGDGAHNGADYNPLDSNGTFCLNAVSFLTGVPEPASSGLLLIGTMLMIAGPALRRYTGRT